MVCMLTFIGIENINIPEIQEFKISIKFKGLKLIEMLFLKRL